MPGSDRDRNAARNLALIRKITLNLVRQAIQADGQRISLKTSATLPHGTPTTVIAFSTVSDVSLRAEALTIFPSFVRHGVIA